LKDGKLGGKGRKNQGGESIPINVKRSQFVNLKGLKKRNMLEKREDWLKGTRNLRKGEGTKIFWPLRQKIIS